MFRCVHSCPQRFDGVVRFDCDDLLGEHRSGIDAFIGDEMHHHTSVFDFAALIRTKCSFDGVSAGEYFRQRRVQVDNPVGKAIE